LIQRLVGGCCAATSVSPLQYADSDTRHGVADASPVRAVRTYVRARRGICPAVRIEADQGNARSGEWHRRGRRLDRACSGLPGSAPPASRPPTGVGQTSGTRPLPEMPPPDRTQCGGVPPMRSRRQAAVTAVVVDGRVEVHRARGRRLRRPAGGADFLSACRLCAARPQMSLHGARLPRRRPTPCELLRHAEAGGKHRSIGLPSMHF
jgi:hypothetical protein